MNFQTYHSDARRFLSWIVLSLSLVVSTSTIHAQYSLFTNQKQFGVEEGLPQSYVSGILQDDDGFIWLSTLDGMCRYDGRVFKVVRSKAKDVTALASNTINNIGPLINNTITLYYSPTHADDLDPRSFKITRNTIRDELRKVHNADWQSYITRFNNTGWIFPTNNFTGIGWLHKQTGKITYANKSNGKLTRDTINAMAQSSEGKLYLVSENGVQIADSNLQKFQWLQFRTGVKKRSLNRNGDVFGENTFTQYLSGNRLAVSNNDSVLILDLNKRISEILPIPPYAYKNELEGTIKLKVDKQDRLYFSSYGRVFRQEKDGALKMLWENTMDPSLRITAVFIDRSDVLWVSVDAKGIYKVDLRALPFYSYKYNSNFISDILEQNGASRSSFPREWNAKEFSYQFRQERNSDGILFVSNHTNDFDKVYKVAPQGLVAFTHSPLESEYSALIVMPNGEVRVYDEKQHCWYNWKTPDAVPTKILLDKVSMANVVLTDAKFIGGYTWMATYSNGLLQYDNNNNRVNRFGGKQLNGFMPETLTEICPDPVDNNKFWIGSRGGGMILWDVKKGLQKVFTIEDGLPNNTIYCIVPDRYGNLWCSSNKGIFKLNPKTNQVTAFEKTDGLPGNEFNRAHKFKFDDGRIAFGGLDGYTIFNPADFSTQNKTGEVPILLTSIQVNNQPQDLNIEGSFLNEPLNTLSNLELPYDKNYLRFEFAAMMFNQPQKTKYRYQLKGADETWIENGNNNIASYAALRPANYVFRINATDYNGLWSDTVKEVNIIIRPPFWGTWWAYLIYAFIAMGVLRWYVLFRENQLQMRQTLAFEKREALRLKEVDEMKDRFFSNITHEFRTPLTLIITPLEKLLQDKTIPEKISITLKTAQRNSKQLLRLINEFLDFSKLNNGQLTLKLSTGQPALFTKDCVDSFATSAQEKNIHLDFKATGLTGLYRFDEEKFEKIIFNLLSNAIKFTPANGEVCVTVEQIENGMLMLTVKDTGPGIPPQQQQKIFDRFYQVDDSSIRNYGGTGIGLALVKELTELMNGTIELESKSGGPTTFRVMLPIEKEVAILSSTETAIPISKGKTEDANSNKPLVMIVEDNDELRHFLVTHMRKQYVVLEAADGLRAWEIILNELPDIIISDVMMPGQDGFDLCKSCKTDNRTSHIGLILLTSKAAHDAKLQGLGCGADDYMTKPFHLDELDIIISNQLHLQDNLRKYLQSNLLVKEPALVLPVVTDPFLVKLYEEMDNGLDDSEMGVDYLSKAMAMSRSTLHRKLKSLLHISANDLIRQYRLQKATTFLLAGDDISVAAYKVGFSSPSYFTQCFREQYNVTPSEFIAKEKSS